MNHHPPQHTPHTVTFVGRSLPAELGPATIIATSHVPEHPPGHLATDDREALWIAASADPADTVIDLDLSASSVPIDAVALDAHVGLGAGDRVRIVGSDALLPVPETVIGSVLGSPPDTSAALIDSGSASTWTFAAPTLDLDDAVDAQCIVLRGRAIDGAATLVVELRDSATGAQLAVLDAVVLDEADTRWVVPWAWTTDLAADRVVVRAQHVKGDGTAAIADVRWIAAPHLTNAHHDAGWLPAAPASPACAPIDAPASKRTTGASIFGALPSGQPATALRHWRVYLRRMQSNDSTVVGARQLIAGPSVPGLTLLRDWTMRVRYVGAYQDETPDGVRHAQPGTTVRGLGLPLTIKAETIQLDAVLARVDALLRGIGTHQVYVALFSGDADASRLAPVLSGVFQVETSNGRLEQRAQVHLERAPASVDVTLDLWEVL
ncbi:MAG: hypothetical protein AAF772_14995 [Acidobacteriota bacterium]